jgi:hypothetical protein
VTRPQLHLAASDVAKQLNKKQKRTTGACVCVCVSVFLGVFVGVPAPEGLLGNAAGGHMSFVCALALAQQQGGCCVAMHGAGRPWGHHLHIVPARSPVPVCVVLCRVVSCVWGGFFCQVCRINGTRQWPCGVRASPPDVDH